MGRPRQFALWLLAFSTQGLLADDARPGIIEIDEVAAMGYVVRWTFPPGITWHGDLEIHLPAHCMAVGATSQSRQYDCEQDLSGHTIGFDFPGLARPVHVVVRLRLLSGEEHTKVLAPSVREWLVPPRETLGRVVSDYFNYGVVHIFKGADHLLFVLCLIWIAGGWRRILWTITAFTIAHSVTLALSALDLVRLATAPVEAVIALSVAFLASEVVRGKPSGLTWRYPATIAAVFGLVHGLGFASVLSDIGLPQTKLVTALLSFNLGVETGQVLFALPITLILSRLRARRGHTHAIRLTIGYGVGSLAAFWVVVRIAEFIA